MGRWIDNGWTDGHMDRWANRWMMEGQMNILADMDDRNGLMDGWTVSDPATELHKVFLLPGQD